MSLTRDDAVILSRLDYSETSQVLVLFTRQHGKVRAIAKGIKRGTKTRFATGVDLLDIGTVVISRRHERSANLAILTEWKQTRALPDLRRNLSTIHAAQYAAEITGHLTEDWDPHAEVFDALTATLAALAEPDAGLDTVVPFQVQLLTAIGLIPRWDACARCARTTDLTHLSSFEGSMICRHCEPGQVEKWEVSAPALDVLRGLCAGRPPAGIGTPVATAAFAVLNYHISHLIGKAPKLGTKLLSTPRMTPRG
ncbi:MAG: DNA repair protein RecO [Phycisphaerae bacterium]